VTDVVATYNFVSRPASLWTQTLVFARRNAEHIRQVPEKLLDVTLQPLMFVVLFAYVFGGAINVGGGGSYREYLLGGILIQSLGFGMMGPGTSIASDLAEGVISRFRAMPSTSTAYLLGHYLAEFAGLVLSIAILFGAGLIVGWRPHSDVLHVVEALVLLGLFASAMVWLGTFMGLMVRSADAVQGIGFMVVFPLTFTSSAFVPVATLPNLLQWVATYNPFSILINAVRTLLGNPVGAPAKDVWITHHPVGGAFAICLAILAIAIPLAVHRFKVRTTD
jgi:ABC-2 type transport system permease protein